MKNINEQKLELINSNKILKSLNTEVDLFLENDDLTIEDIENIIEEIENGGSDFHITIPSTNEEYRIIKDGTIIEDIFNEYAEEMLDSCYNIDENIRPYIDMEKWTSDLAADGYGNAFATYDSNEYYNDGYYFFRTN